MRVLFVPPENDENRYLSSLAEHLEQRGVEVIDYSWAALLPLLSPVNTERPDVIHIHWLDTLTIGSTWQRTVFKGLRTPLELLIARLFGVTIVWTVHNLAAHDRTYPRWDLFWRIVVARWGCDHLIVHCDAAEEAARDRYHLSSTAPVTVIPHGHYLNEYPDDVSRMEAKESFGFGEKETVFTFFGQIRPYKQVPYLIDVFQKLDHEKARLMITGNPKGDATRRAIDEECAHRDDILTRLEFIPEDDVAQFFKASDVVVLPYRNILTSGTAILSMSFSRPVIAPRIGCLPELVTDGVDGFLYDPDDPRGLERAMLRAIDADLTTMGENGHETVSELDWASIATRTQRVYNS